MIGKLRGNIDSTADDHVILDVNGVGYSVYCSPKTLHYCISHPKNVSLFIETHVREDHIQLFGFSSLDEKACFLKLTTVKGVGARIGLAILGVGTPDAIATAIAARDKALFTQASGVGPKLAERIITELKDAVIGVAFAAPSQEKAGKEAAPSLTQDVVQALTQLGYNRSEAWSAASRVMHDNPDLSIEEAMRLTLRELAA